MVRTGTIKLKKRSISFWIPRPFYQRVIVDGPFVGALVSAGALKIQISLSKINFDQKHFFYHLDNFYEK